MGEYSTTLIFLTTWVLGYLSEGLHDSVVSVNSCDYKEEEEDGSSRVSYLKKTGCLNGPLLLDTRFLVACSTFS